MMCIAYSDLLAVLLAYLLGAIPFSYLVARWKAGINIYEHGEGNVGARNVYHVVGPKWGVLAGVLDVGKGTAACLLARHLAVSQAAFLAAGFAAPWATTSPPSCASGAARGSGRRRVFSWGSCPFPLWRAACGSRRCISSSAI